MSEDADVTGLGFQHLAVEHQDADQVEPTTDSKPTTTSTLTVATDRPAYSGTSSKVPKMPTATEMNANETANT